MQPTLQERLKQLIWQDSYRIHALQAARKLQLPDWYLAAGFVRNLVWDELHGFSARNLLSDIDLIYFDPHDITKDTETQYETRLQAIAPGFPWSVKNQARMHLPKNEEAYNSTDDAMSRWPETATAVGVRLEADNSLTIIAPYGLLDLFELILRPSPMCRQSGVFNERIKAKRWLEIWPKVTVITA